jgi:acetoin utilization deacetylase AcuC-like enzyme
MITIFSDEQYLHHGRYELIDGRLQPPVERPERAELILARVREVGLGPVVAPEHHGLDPIFRIHDRALVEFLQGAHHAWKSAHGDGDALPFCWPVQGLRRVEPQAIDGKLGYFSFDAATPIMAGTWTAARASVDTALTGASRLASGQSAVFALCRPPGHHALSDRYGGYCFLNNAAVAAQALRDAGAKRVAILDVDYHHGNGTQSIFYERSDVLVVSLHADPSQEYPYFLGYAGETGSGEGHGFNHNYPMPWGSDWDRYAEALEAGLGRVREYDPDALLVSLGVDAYHRDPISRFALTTDDFHKIGRAIASARLPTLFVMEGGYALDEVGINCVAVLTAFESP